MKRVKILAIAVSILLVALVTGCAGEPVVNATVSGGFVAKVRLLLPNYTLDDFTLSEAVVTTFQSGPFIVSVGQELASQLQTGEMYFLEIEPKEIGEIPQSEFDRGCQNVEVAMVTHNLRIVGARVAREDEKGMQFSRMIYEKTE